MNFTVIWLTAAEQELLQLYLVARDRGDAERVTRAAAEIDRELETHPDQRGESRTGAGRVLFAPPLVADFEVHVNQRVAVVTRVRYRPRR